MNKPYTFQDQALQDYFNLQPSEVKGRNNTEVAFYKRMLWTKLYSVFKFELPDNWAENFFRFWLFHYGSIAVIYTQKFGWIAQPYSVEEIDLYYNPKKIRVYNQFIKDPKVGIIGANSGIIKIMDDYYGLDALITKYATQLAQTDRAIDVNLMNSNVTMLFEAENKKEAEEIKSAYGEATTGKPLVVVNKEIMNGKSLTTMLGNVKNNYIAQDLLATRRGIMNAFLTEVGIKNANMEKRERLNSQEVEENNDETRAIVSVIYDNLKKCMSDINKISGLNLDVSMRYNYTIEGGGDIE